MLSLQSIDRPVCRFFRDRQGNILPFLALAMFFVLVPAVGIAIDYTRAVQFKTALQGMADAAAIAGATVYTDDNSATLAQTTAQKYMDLATPKLPKNNGVGACPSTASPSTGKSTSGTSTTSYNVTITVCASLKTTFLSIFTPTLPIRVTATAQDKIVLAKVTFGNFNTSAWDQNSAYWYQIPSTANPATYTPSDSDLHLIWTNDPSQSSNDTSKSFDIPAAAQIGFALKNVTGGRDPTGKITGSATNYAENKYGGTGTLYNATTSKGKATTTTDYSSSNHTVNTPPSTQWFYSNKKNITKSVSTNANSATYSRAPNNNCNLQVQTVTDPKHPPTAETPKKNQTLCYSANPANASPSCANLADQTMLFSWNDMGGIGADDYDYNDLVYQFTCSGGGSGSSGVALTN